jgi:hypothetical protein
MTTLIFECPRTRRVIDAGIHTDEDTLAGVRSIELKVYCSHCCNTHEFPVAYGRLSEDQVEVLGVRDTRNHRSSVSQSTRY